MWSKSERVSLSVGASGSERRSEGSPESVAKHRKTMGALFPRGRSGVRGWVGVGAVEVAKNLSDHHLGLYDGAVAV